MANDISGPVWRIDTIPFSYVGPVKIKNVIWTEMTTPGDQFVMQSQASKTLIDTKAYAANYDQIFKDIEWIPTNPPGIKITTLTSGVVLIAIGAGR